MSEVYEMAFTAAVGLVVLYAITRSESHRPPPPPPFVYQPTAAVAPQPTAVPVQEKPSQPTPVPVQEKPSQPTPVPVQEKKTVVDVIAQPQEPHHQQQQPSWMSKNPSFLMDDIEEEEEEKMVDLNATASWQSFVSPQVVERVESPSWMATPEPIEEVPHTHVVIETLNHKLSKFAQDTSDNVFIYPLGTTMYLGQALAPTKRIHVLETRVGAGDAVLGCASLPGSKTTVLMSSASLLPMLPAIKRMVLHKLRVTFFVSLVRVKEDLELVHSHGDLSLIRQLGCPTYVSGFDPSNMDHSSGPVFYVVDHLELNDKVMAGDKKSNPSSVLFVALGGHVCSQLEALHLPVFRVTQVLPSLDTLLPTKTSSPPLLCVVDDSVDESLFRQVQRAAAPHQSVSLVRVDGGTITLDQIRHLCDQVGLPPLSAVPSKESEIIMLSKHTSFRVPKSVSFVRVSSFLDSFAQITLTEYSSSRFKHAVPVAKVLVVAKDVVLEESHVQYVATGGSVILSKSTLSEEVAHRLSAKQVTVVEYTVGDEDKTVWDMAVHHATTFKSAVACATTAAGTTATTRKSLGHVDFTVDALNSDNNHALEPESRLVPRLSFATSSTTTLVDAFQAARKHQVAWNLVFPKAFDTTNTVEEEGIFYCKLVVRKRLTPQVYDRNIFHLEFDIAHSGLKYEIGDALGVFAHNSEEEVDAFLRQYQPKEDFVSMKRSGNRCEFVSVRNLLLQHLDLFGRPTKKFYLWLSDFAQSKYERLKLMHVGTDDTEAFKVNVNETFTFADVLLLHPSARPSMDQLLTVVPMIKPRHYSIASSMKFSPSTVSLLIVQVEWKTPMGRIRQGQCTRYLNELALHSRVRVEVCPSVLRLPPSCEQPIVMAGLGTGMAPFRAFVQERAMQREAGLKVGPILLYFGARHRSEEWLYGEEWDQYVKEGLVTKLGLAFSRDQQEKIYIQHKIKEDASLLHRLFMEEQGYFYLCGPTWPVPDVRDAMAFGLDPVSADPQVVEQLKEEGRYILEVY